MLAAGLLSLTRPHHRSPTALCTLSFQALTEATAWHRPSAMSSGSSSFADAADLEQSLRYANDNVQAQLTSELVHSMQNKCFKACVTQPADSLSSREERCLHSCMDKFLSSRQLIAELYAATRQTR